MYELKKMERYLRVNMLGPGHRLTKIEFTGSRSNEVSETLLYSIWYRHNLWKLRQFRCITFARLLASVAHQQHVCLTLR